MLLTFDLKKMLLACVLRSLGSTERVLPLHGSDSSSDDAPADLPLRDEVDPARSTGRALFGAYQTPGTSLPEDSVRPAGAVRIWIIAAVSLVVGILIGFGSGFTAGQRAGTSAAADPGAGTSTPFSEAAVKEPVQVEPEPVVPPGGAAASVTRDPSPQVEQKAPAAPPAESRRAPTAPARRVPPPAATEPARRVDASESAGRDTDAASPVATGPGSIEVVSRPSGAQVILDGRSVGRTPLSLPEVSNGAHDIRLDLPGFRQWATSVQVIAGQRTRVAASLEQ